MEKKPKKNGLRKSIKRRMQATARAIILVPIWIAILVILYLYALFGIYRRD